MLAFYWVAVAAIIIVSSARITRLAVYDHFPPVKWVRDKYADATDGSDWQLLALCGYCASFWVTSAVVGWAYVAGVLTTPAILEPTTASTAETVWWLFNGSMALSYLAAVFVANDGDKDEEDEN